VLEARKSVWTGEAKGFLAPAQVAFGEGATAEEGLCRYLALVPPSLCQYDTLLRALGVKNEFVPAEFARANACFVRDFGCVEPLSEEVLAECVATLRAAASSPNRYRFLLAALSSLA